MKEILDMLLAIIAENGPDYPEKNSYSTYRALLERGADPRKARLIFLTLEAGIPKLVKETPQEELAQIIQKECLVKSKPADSLATMYAKLYSPAQETSWAEQEEAGFRAFCSCTWKLAWDGEATWHGDGVHQDSYASFTAEFEVVDETAARKAAADLLGKNPFADEETVWHYISGLISTALQDALEGFVDCDIYTPPYMDNYWDEVELPDWDSLVGLAIIENTDSYRIETGDYEPDNPRRRW